MRHPSVHLAVLGAEPANAPDGEKTQRSFDSDEKEPSASTLATLYSIGGALVLPMLTWSGGSCGQRQDEFSKKKQEGQAKRVEKHVEVERKLHAQARAANQPSTIRRGGGEPDTNMILSDEAVIRDCGFLQRYLSKNKDATPGAALDHVVGWLSLDDVLADDLWLAIAETRATLALDFDEGTEARLYAWLHVKLGQPEEIGLLRSVLHGMNRRDVEKLRSGLRVPRKHKPAATSLGDAQIVTAGSWSAQNIESVFDRDTVRSLGVIKNYKSWSLTIHNYAVSDLAKGLREERIKFEGAVIKAEKAHADIIGGRLKEAKAREERETVLGESQHRAETLGRYLTDQYSLLEDAAKKLARKLRREAFPAQKADPVEFVKRTLSALSWVAEAKSGIAQIAEKRTRPALDRKQNLVHALTKIAERAALVGDEASRAGSARMANEGDDDNDKHRVHAFLEDVKSTFMNSKKDHYENLKNLNKTAAHNVDITMGGMEGQEQRHQPRQSKLIVLTSALRDGVDRSKEGWGFEVLRELTHFLFETAPTEKDFLSKQGNVGMLPHFADSGRWKLLLEEFCEAFGDVSVRYNENNVRMPRPVGQPQEEEDHAEDCDRDYPALLLLFSREIAGAIPLPRHETIFAGLRSEHVVEADPWSWRKFKSNKEVLAEKLRSVMMHLDGVVVRYMGVFVLLRKRKEKHKNREDMAQRTIAMLHLLLLAKKHLLRQEQKNANDYTKMQKMMMTAKQTLAELYLGWKMEMPLANPEADADAFLAWLLVGADSERVVVARPHEALTWVNIQPLKSVKSALDRGWKNHEKIPDNKDTDRFLNDDSFWCPHDLQRSPAPETADWGLLKDMRSTLTKKLSTFGDDLPQDVSLSPEAKKALEPFVDRSKWSPGKRPTATVTDELIDKTAYDNFRGTSGQPWVSDVWMTPSSKICREDRCNYENAAADLYLPPLMNLKSCTHNIDAVASGQGNESSGPTRIRNAFAFFARTLDAQSARVQAGADTGNGQNRDATLARALLLRKGQELLTQLDLDGGRHFVHTVTEQIAGEAMADCISDLARGGSLSVLRCGDRDGEVPAVLRYMVGNGWSMRSHRNAVPDVHRDGSYRYWPTWMRRQIT
eukprot:g273.t1